jgi:hypothetical protein
VGTTPKQTPSGQTSPQIQTKSGPGIQTDTPAQNAVQKTGEHIQNHAPLQAAEENSDITKDEQIRRLKDM